MSKCKPTSSCKFVAEIMNCSRKDYSVACPKSRVQDPKRDELTMSRMNPAEGWGEVRTRELCNTLG